MLGQIHAQKISSSIQMVTGSGFRGQVHSVFQRVLNIISEGVLITLVDQSNGELPNGLLLDLPLDQDFQSYALRPGALCCGDGRHLFISQAGFYVNISKVAIFSPKKALRPPLLSPDLQAERLLEIHKTAMQYAPKEGLASLWQPSAELLCRANGHQFSNSILLASAQKAINKLFRGIRQPNPETIQQGVSGLAGLGVGLTPSGDDILTGLAASITLYENACGVPGHHAALFQTMLETERSRSNQISFNYLQQAMRAELSPELFEFIRCLFEIQSGSSELAIQKLFSFGATSGSELGLGAFLGASFLAETEIQAENLFSIPKLNESELAYDPENHY